MFNPSSYLRKSGTYFTQVVTQWCFVATLLLSSLTGCSWLTTPPPPPPEVPVQPDTVTLDLQRAQAAFLKDRLTTPASDNAYHYYQQVLAAEPDNALAQAGVEAIVERYFELVAISLNKGKWQQADRYLTRAETVGGRTAHTGKLRRQIDAVRTKARAARKKAPSVSAGPEALTAVADDFYLLNPGRLQRRDASLQRALQGLGGILKTINAAFIITAPSDNDGRWVYQQMKAGAPGYRLRGNIQRGSKPSVKVVPGVI